MQKPNNLTRKKGIQKKEEEKKKKKIIYKTKYVLHSLCYINTHYV